MKIKGAFLIWSLYTSALACIMSLFKIGVGLGGGHYGCKLSSRKIHHAKQKNSLRMHKRLIISFLCQHNIRGCNGVQTADGEMTEWVTFTKHIHVINALIGKTNCTGLRDSNLSVKTDTCAAVISVQWRRLAVSHWWIPESFNFVCKAREA